MTIRVLLPALACSWIATAAADQTKRPRHDPLDEIAAVSIGEFVGGGLAKAAEGAASFSKNAAEASNEIDAARKAFWSQYPNGPRRAQAEAEFARKLYAKDLYFLTMARVDGRCRGGVLPKQMESLGNLVKMAGGEIDGGLADGTSREFCRWVDAARGRDANSATALPEYKSYKLGRDWAEFVRAGKIAFESWADFYESKDPKWYVLGLIWGANEYGISRDKYLEGSFPEIFQRTRDTFDILAKTYGREKVLGIARQLMEAPKKPPHPPTIAAGFKDDNYRRLADPKAIGCINSPYSFVDECFFELVLPRTETKSVAPPVPVTHSGRGGRGAARAAAPPAPPPATTPPVATTPPAPTTPESPPAPAARPTTTAPPTPGKLPSEQKETPSEGDAKINKDVSDKTASIVGDLKKKSDAQLAKAEASKAASGAAAQRPAEAPPQSASAPAGPAWQPCGGDLKSGASQTAVPVEFVNASKQPRKLIWFDFSGAKIVAGVLQPGQRAPMQTYMTHAWMIADGSDQCMGTLVISKPGSIEIR